MSSNNLLRLGGLAAVIAGILRGIGSFVPLSVAILVPKGAANDRLELFYLVTDLFILFGIMGFYGFGHEEAGLWGFVGFVLAIVGNGIIIGPDGKIFGFDLYPVGSAILAVGLDFLVIGAWRVNKLPRWTLVLLGLSPILGFGGYFFRSLDFLFILSGLLFGIGFTGSGSQVWLATSDLHNSKPND